MTSAPKRCATMLTLATLFVVGGCNDGSSAGGDEDNSERRAPPPRLANEASPKGSVTLTLGDEVYDLDSITCIGTSMATAVAKDRADRDGYPTVTLKTFDPAMTGGIDSNTASIQFRDSTRNELWVLDEGSVSRDGNSFHALGTAKGNLMVTQPDGTQKPQPLTGVSSLPLQATIACR